MLPKQLLLQVLLEGCRSQPENEREKYTLNTHQKSSARPSWPKWEAQVRKVVQHGISAKPQGWHRGRTTGLRSHEATSKETHWRSKLTKCVRSSKDGPSRLGCFAIPPATPTGLEENRGPDGFRGGRCTSEKYLTGSTRRSRAAAFSFFLLSSQGMQTFREEVGQIPRDPEALSEDAASEAAAETETPPLLPPTPSKGERGMPGR